MDKMKASYRKEIYQLKEKNKALSKQCEKNSTNIERYKMICSEAQRSLQYHEKTEATIHEKPKELQIANKRAYSLFNRYCRLEEVLRDWTDGENNWKDTELEQLP